MNASRANVLFLCPTFAPAGGTGSLRMVKWVKYLSRQGTRCDVVTGTANQTEYRDESLLADIPSAVDVRRVALGGGLVGNFFRLLRAVRNQNKENRYRWLVTTSPEERNHFYGYGISSILGMKWHCDLRDPVGGRGTGLKRWLICRADWTTTAWPPDDLLEKLNKHDDVEWVPNGYDPEEFPDVPPTRPEESPLKLIHTGSLYRPHQDPRPILRVLSELKDEHQLTPDDLQVRFIGAVVDDELSDALPGFLREHDLDGFVTVTGFTTHREAVDTLNESDVGLIFHGKPALSYKFFEYLGARLPTVLYYAGDSPMNRVAGDLRGVEWVDSGDRQRLKKTLKRIIVDREFSTPSEDVRSKYALPECLKNVVKRYQADP